MVIHSKARDMLAWLLPHCAKFPREQRHMTTQHIARLAMQLHDSLIAARHGSNTARVRSLNEADIALDQLRQYLLLAYQWQWISANQLEHISRLLLELGRLLGGWLKTSLVKTA